MAGLLQMSGLPWRVTSKIRDLQIRFGRDTLPPRIESCRGFGLRRWGPFLFQVMIPACSRFRLQRLFRGFLFRYELLKMAIDRKGIDEPTCAFRTWELENDRIPPT